ncbi:MAG: hypothetical protein AB7F31_02385 [Parachlamydiales bacterium]
MVKISEYTTLSRYEPETRTRAAHTCYFLSGLLAMATLYTGRQLRTRPIVPLSLGALSIATFALARRIAAERFFIVRWETHRDISDFLLGENELVWTYQEGKQTHRGMAGARSQYMINSWTGKFSLGKTYDLETSEGISEIHSLVGPFPDGSVVGASEDSIVLRWDSTGKVVRTWKWEGREILNLDYSPDSKVVVAGVSGGTSAYCQDTEDDSYGLGIEGDPIWSACDPGKNSDRHVFATDTGVGVGSLQWGSTTHLFSTPNPICVLDKMRHWVIGLCREEQNTSIRIFNTKTCDEVKQIPLKWQPQDLQLIQGRLFAIGSDRVWSYDLETEESHELPTSGPAIAVKTVAWDPQFPDLIVTSDTSGGLQFWSLSTKELKAKVGPICDGAPDETRLSLDLLHRSVIHAARRISPNELHTRTVTWSQL